MQAAPPTTLGAWSMAVVLWQQYECIINSLQYTHIIFTTLGAWSMAVVLWQQYECIINSLQYTHPYYIHYLGCVVNGSGAMAAILI